MMMMISSDVPWPYSTFVSLLVTSDDCFPTREDHQRARNQTSNSGEFLTEYFISVGGCRKEDIGPDRNLPEHARVCLQAGERWWVLFFLSDHHHQCQTPEKNQPFTHSLSSFSDFLTLHWVRLCTVFSFSLPLLLFPVVVVFLSFYIIISEVT